MIALRSWVLYCALLGLTAPLLAAICTDPPLLQIDDLVESRYGSPDPTPPNTSEAFGGPIAIHGDWMVVGARRDDQDQSNNYDSGAAYVYERENGVWEFRQKLLSDDIEGGDEFGAAVDIFEEWVVIGAPQSDDNGDASGSAYVFKRDLVTDLWSQFQKLLPSDPNVGQNHRFGTSVAVDAAIPAENPNPVVIHTIVVGAPDHPGNIPFGCCGGAIYLYQLSGGISWDGGTVAIAPDAGDAWEGENFGNSVDIRGDGIVVGAVNDRLSPPGGFSAGAAYFLQRRNLVGTWGFDFKFVASDAEIGDNFGYRVAMDQDQGNNYVVVVGEPGDEATYVYVGNTNLWSETILTATDTTANPGAYGIDVGVSLPLLIVGAAGSSPPPPPGGADGALYFYERTDTNSWNELGWRAATERSAGGSTFFSEDVAIDEHTAAASAPGFDNAAGEPQITNQGQLYVFEGRSIFTDGFESGDVCAWNDASP